MKRGFTLVEMAIALVVLGLIIAIGIPLFSLLVKQNKLAETRTVIKEEKIALQGFAQMHGRLPWADTDGDGREDTNSTTGFLPYVTLGVRGEDAWLQRVYYDVNQQLASTSDLSQFCQTLTQIATNGSADYPQTPSGEMATVFFSPGENHKPDGLDADVNSSSNDRIYEDEAKAISSTNDDVVGELSISYLAGLLCAGSSSGGGSSCTTYTATISNSTGVKYVSVSGVAFCVRLNAGGTLSYNNLAATTSVKVYSSLILCRFNWPSTLISGTVKDLDSNGDCTAQVSCTSLLACSSQ